MDEQNTTSPLIQFHFRSSNIPPKTEQNVGDILLEIAPIDRWNCRYSDAVAVKI